MAAVEPVDVIVVGQTPAGCAAAIQARRQGHSVLLAGGCADGDSAPALEWVGPAAKALLDECGVALKKADAAGFHGVRLRTWELKQDVQVDQPELAGCIVRGAVLADALMAAAKRAGAKLAEAGELAEIGLGERDVCLRWQEGAKAHGRFLIIADGIDSQAAELARLPLVRRSESVAARFALAAPENGAKPAMEVVVGARRSPQIVTIRHGHGQCVLTLLTRSQDPPAEEQLAAFLATAQRENVFAMPVGEAVRPRVRPVAAALDLDSHVGKRCVLVGEAGGFVSAFSDESLYPCLRSGCLAADTVHRALAAGVPQDELLSFSAAWRAELADYLRMPNTDLALLMPLVFNNPQMSARVARAFLLGQGF